MCVCVCVFFVQEQLQEKRSRASRYNHLNTDSPAKFFNSPLGMDLAHEVMTNNKQQRSYFEYKIILQ